MATLSEILAGACSSGIGRARNPVQLWQLIASLWNSLPSPNPPTSSLSDGLAHYWKMDEASSTPRLDSVGSITLNEAGTVIASTGIINNGASPQSTSSAGSAFLGSSMGSISIQSDFSLSFWFYTAAYANWRIAFHLYKSSAPAGEIFRVQEYGPYSPTNSMYVSFDGIGGGFVTDTVAQSQWHHYAVVVSGLNMMVYRNSSLKATFALSNTARTNPNQIRVMANQAGYCWAWSRVDEMGWWNRALTLAEVQQLYNSGAALPLSSFWP